MAIIVPSACVNTISSPPALQTEIITKTGCSISKIQEATINLHNILSRIF